MNRIDSDRLIGYDGDNGFSFTQKAGTRKIFRGKNHHGFSIRIFRGKTIKESL
jgi:hypothetical protein